MLKDDQYTYSNYGCVSKDISLMKQDIKINNRNDTKKRLEI